MLTDMAGRFNELGLLVSGTCVILGTQVALYLVAKSRSNILRRSQSYNATTWAGHILLRLHRPF
jgi:hypothetical protein